MHPRQLVTVGKAARMLRVTRQCVRWYIGEGELAFIEATGARGRQLLLLEQEVLRFNQARALRARPRALPRLHGGQYELPLQPARVWPAARRPWNLIPFRMAKARLVDRQVKRTGTRRVS